MVMAKSFELRLARLLSVRFEPVAVVEVVVVVLVLEVQALLVLVEVHGVCS
jgi:hypothetical protein